MLHAAHFPSLISKESFKSRSGCTSTHSPFYAYQCLGDNIRMTPWLMLKQNEHMLHQMPELETVFLGGRGGDPSSICPNVLVVTRLALNQRQ